MCLAYFGDGAANQGQVYETFNMAALWKLPIVFVIENNGYAMGTAVKRCSARDRVLPPRHRVPHSRAWTSTGWTCSRCARRPRSRFAHVRGGNGPVLMELNTYRYRGHSMSDPAKYRTREEVQGDARASSDPIERRQGRTDRAAASARTSSRTSTSASARRSPKRPTSPKARPSRRPSELYTDVLVETLLMAIELKMPALSPTMEEGTLAKWLVKEGDEVTSGDVLAEIETDKATMEFEAVDEGTVGKILVPEGTENVKVGTVIAMLAGEGEDASALPRRRRPPLPRSRAAATQKAAESEAPKARRRRRATRRSSPSDAKPARRSRDPRRHQHGQASPCARRCATRWPRRCAATSACS